MRKKNYLTGREQEIYASIRFAYVVKVEEVRDIFPELSQGMLHKLLSSMAAKGYLYRVKRGLYLVHKEPSSSPVVEDPYKLALSLFNGYIGFSSALKLHGLIEYEPFTILVATPDRSATRELGNYTFRAVSLGEKAVGLDLRDGLYISNIEKTFFDCFYKPQHGGGYGTVTRALYEQETMDWDGFMRYFEQFASPGLCQRTGYVLDKMKEELGFRVPDNVLSRLQGMESGTTKLIPSSLSRGKYSSKWNVLDNAGHGAVLGWYHGH
ncbi:MAG: hypothetical protein QCI38_03900 [Candidatus Thermoplasmatota archaeon]|nr:hypothetical protein [Candidatus Thermoplasmatota archaeon]